MSTTLKVQCRANALGPFVTVTRYAFQKQVLCVRQDEWTELQARINEAFRDGPPKPKRVLYLVTP